jgi:hypothetical protein
VASARIYSISKKLINGALHDSDLARYSPSIFVSLDVE